jgi:hypothetical protein
VLDQLGTNLPGNEVVTLLVGVDAVTSQHGIGVAVGARAVGNQDGGLGSRVLLAPAGDGAVDSLDGRVAPARGDDLVDLHRAGQRSQSSGTHGGAFSGARASLTMTLTFGFTARMLFSNMVYESMMVWVLRLPMLTSLVPSINWTMSG